MNLKNIVSATVTLTFFTATSAIANQPAGPVIIPEIFILPVMILLSVIGGAYAVLNRTQGKKTRTSWVFLWVAAIFVIFLSAIHEGLACLVAIIFGVIALKRGIQMIIWGIQARHNLENKEHLLHANPKRLIPSGVILIFITIFLVGMATALLGYYHWMEFGRNIRKREAYLKDFVTYKLAYAKWEENSTGKTFFQPITENMKKYNEHKDFSPAYYNLQTEYSENGKHFTVYLLPKHFPFFPYNYFVSRPSYRADEIGQIRMVMVHKRDKKCHRDAPIVMQVSELGVKKALRAIENRKQVVKKGASAG